MGSGLLSRVGGIVASQRVTQGKDTQKLDKIGVANIMTENWILFMSQEKRSSHGAVMRQAAVNPPHH